MIEIKLKKFNINNIDNSSSIIIIGNRACGKTTLINNLTSSSKNKTIITYQKDGYKNINNINNICTEFSTEIVKNFVEQHIESFKNTMNTSSCLILDDCITYSKTLDDRNLRNIFMNSHLLKIDLLISMQYCQKLSRTIIDNIDHFIIFNNLDNKKIYKTKEDKDEAIIINKRNLKNIYMNFTHIFKNFEIFYTIINSLNKYECLVINNFNLSSGLENSIFWYKVDLNTNTKKIILSKL